MTEETIFATALEKRTPAELLAFLDEACGSDVALRRRVEGLLKANDQAGDFLERPAVEQPDDETRADDSAAESDDSLAFLEPPTRPGSLGRIGHYEVLEVLGRGGFGTVFRAFDDVLQRVVAVKVLSPQMAATSPARKRFVREARSSAAVRHENVVQIHETGERPLPYLVMEFVPGETLQQRLDRTGPLDVAEVLRIGRQVAEGLAAAHATGLIHRDVKPSNVLIDAGPQERVKLTDFGLARTADDASLSQSGIVAGTPLYMAPEQARGDALDHRADLFSLGSVLYAVLTGRPPFRADTTLAVLKRVAEDSPRPIRQIIPEVPGWLCRVVHKLHAKSPDDRFQTAREVADVLADCESQLRIHGGLRDFSRIPGGKPGRTPVWLWAALLFTAVVCLGIILTAFGLWGTTQKGMTTPARQTTSKGGGMTAPETDFTPAASTPDPAPPLAVAPFGSETAQVMQESWAKHHGVEPEITHPVGMKFRLIPPGEFMRGSSVAEIDWLLTQAPDLKDAQESVKDDVRSEGPELRVTIREPFWLGTHEVTVGQFREFVKATEYKTEAEKLGFGQVWDDTVKDWVKKPEYVWTNPAYAPDDAHPVVFVTPADAQAFCEWLGKQDGRRYVLPTEDQWEYACRAGTTTRWFFGHAAAEMSKYGWTKPHTYGKNKPVGRLEPNPFGLYDVYGNAIEMTTDGRGRMVERGGDAGVSPQRSRSASRYVPSEGYTTFRRGFRVAAVGVKP